MNDVTGAGGQCLRAPPTAALADRPRRLAYDGRTGDLARISITNSLLTLVTLGVYRFWGKTRLRRYLWSRVDFMDDRLEYSGRGIELFLGFAVALLILAPLFGTVIWAQVAYRPETGIPDAVEGFQALVILFLIHVALYRARRYRMTRTQWRGIRAGQDGSAFGYALRAFGWSIVAGLTLGLAYPVYRARLQHYRTTHTTFGDRHLEFEGRASDLMTPWVVAWLVSLVTLGLGYILVYPWYRVREFRYFASKTRYGNLTFHSELSAGTVYGIFALHMLAVTVLMVLAGVFWFLVPGFGGLGGIFGDVAAGNGEIAPVASASVVAGFFTLLVVIMVAFNLLQIVLFVHPLFKVVCDSLFVSGNEDFAAIAQSQQARPDRGEGLADALDVSPF